MKPIRFNSLVLILLSFAALLGCQSSPALEADFAFVGVSVIDLESGTVQTDQVVLINNRTIVHIESFAQIILPTNLKTVFADGQFLLPIVVDSHVLAFGDPKTTRLKPNRDFSGMSQKVEIGHPAEVVLLAQNPLIDVTAVNSVSGVYSRGRWYNQTQLDELKRERLN